MYSNRFIVIDLQGFFIDDKLFVEEVSILHNINDVFKIKTFLIKSPFKCCELTNKEKRTNKWLYYNLHGLSWKDGSSTLKEVIEYLTLIIENEKFSIIYVKGSEKEKWLQELFKTIEQKICIFNLTSCANISTLYKNNSHINICNYHKQNITNNLDLMCAEKSVILIRNYIYLCLIEEKLDKLS